MARVSLGVPVYNGMPYLPDAIQSLLAQDYDDLEVVICDNASTDGTEDYCRAIAARVPHVRYHRFDTNSGSSVNFQRCLELSSGEYFAWAAHDDRLHPRFVSTCLAILEKRPEAVMCSPAKRVIDEGDNLLWVRPEPTGLSSDDLETRLRAHLWRRGWLTIYGLARRHALEAAGPPAVVWGSDVLLVWRLLLLGPIEVTTQPLADYRVFRRKTEDSVLAGITGGRASVEWVYTGMKDSLSTAAMNLPVDERTRAIARKTVRRWVWTRHFRELLFMDLYVVLRRRWSRRQRLAAAAVVPPMVALSPRMVVRGMRRWWESRAEKTTGRD